MTVQQPARTADDYLDLLRRLSPPGLAFGDTEGRWDDLLEAIAQELGLIDASVSDTAGGVPSGLVSETDPRTATETLPAWEYMLGLTAGSLSTAQRQDQAYSAMIATGGQSPGYFIAIAAPIMTITIDEPLAVGWNPCSPPCAPMYGVGARFTWVVHGGIGASTARKSMLESLINKYKPAHTLVFFLYDIV